MSAFERMFHPRGIAVVGASGDLTRTGGQAVHALNQYGYKGGVYPVNPKYPELAGRRCYPSLAAIDGVCDLAVVALPAAQVPAIIAQCGERGIGYAVVLGGGFRENGAEGARIEADMLAQARRHGIRIIGPNCLGLVSVHDRVFAAFGSITRAPELRPGPVSAAIQSGGLGNSLVIRSSLAGAGFRYLVSTGNEADVGLSELIDAYVDDPQTRVILTYLEGVNDGRALMRSLRRACLAGKPVVVLKGGNTDAGKAAASSHTANLTGSYDIYRAAFQQCGAIEVEDLDQAADYVLCLLNGRLPRGRNVAAMGASGGSAAVFSDAAESYGLGMPPFAETTLAVLKETLPPIASLRNPVDYTSGYPRPDTLDAFQRAFDAVMGDPDVHQLGLLFATPSRRQLTLASELLANTAARSDKPLFVFSVIPPEITPEGIETLKRAGIPVMSSPRRVARAMAMLADYAQARERVRSAAAVPDDRAPAPVSSIPPGRIVLDELESKTLLARAGIPVTRDVLLPLEAVESACADVRFPVAVKIASRDLLHKSDIGAVVLNVTDKVQLRAAATRVVKRTRRARPDARLSGVLASEMIADGVEVIVGAVNDPGFGPVVALGMGGIFTELLDDVTYGIAPFGREEALRMIDGLRGRKVFDGLRGRSARDVDALVSTLVRVSELAWQLRDRLVEMDINPLLVRARGDGVVAADAVISLRERGPGEAPR